MKIGILTWDLALRGGTQRQIAELARELRRVGDEVVVYAVYYDPGVYPDILAGVSVKHLLPGDRMVRGSNRRILGLHVGALSTLYLEWKLNRRIADLPDADLDVLNVHDNSVFVGAALWKRRTGKPVVWTMNDFPGAVVPIRRFRWTFLNRILEVATGRFWVRRAYWDAISHMDRVIVLDENISRRLLVDHLGVEPITIRSGLDLSKFVYETRESYRGGRPFTIMTSGIFFPHRRLEDVAESVRILVALGIDVLWNHVGSEELDPAYANFVRRRVEEGGISSRTHLLGKVSDVDLVRLYRTADAFVFPNSPQTWGLAVFEAMACGTPTIVSRGAGASEVLTDGTESFLVDPACPEQIARHIETLATEPDTWVRMSEAGRRFVEKDIRWDLYAQRMRGVMNAL